MSQFLQKKTKQLARRKQLVNKRNHKSNKNHHKPINFTQNKMIGNNLHSKLKIICQILTTNKRQPCLKARDGTRHTLGEHTYTFVTQKFLTVPFFG